MISGKKFDYAVPAPTNVDRDHQIKDWETDWVTLSDEELWDLAKALMSHFGYEIIEEEE